MKSNYIHFFGTTGNKNLIFGNRRSAGGVYINIDDTKIVFDPGPGTLNKFAAAYPNEIYNIDAVVLSHVHFDHSNDVNIFIEGMTDEGNNKRGTVIAPAEALQGEDGVIKSYLRSFPERIIVAEPSTDYIINNIRVRTSIPHKHGVENYGYTFYFNSLVVTFLTDTVYFEGLAESYPQSDVLIINVPYASVPQGKKMKHLSLESVPHIISCIKPKKVILTHFGDSMLDANPTECARSLSKELMCDIVAAEDDGIYMLP